MLTNDLGYIHPQNGKLYFCGRADDVIRTGGELVLASDVECVILDYFAAAAAAAGDNHDHAIVECAMFPLPDEKVGDAVCAAIAVAAIETSMPSSTASVVGRGTGAVAATSSVKLNTGNNKNHYNNIEPAVVTIAEEDADLGDNIRRYFAKRQIAGYSERILSPAEFLGQGFQACHYSIVRGGGVDDATIEEGSKKSSVKKRSFCHRIKLSSKCYSITNYSRSIYSVQHPMHIL